MAKRTMTLAADGATVIINGVERTTFCAEEGTLIEWSVSAEGYQSQSGSFILADNVSMVVKLLLPRVTFTIQPTPSDAMVTINGEHRINNSIEVIEGTEVVWEVSAEHYVSQSGTETITEDTVKEVVLEQITYYTFTIQPTPSDATVTINGEERKSITVPYGTEVVWEVSAEGYASQSGTETITEDTIKDVALKAEPFTFVYDNNSMYIYRGTAYSSSSTNCLFAISGDYDIEINGVMIEDVTASTTFGSDYLNDTGNVVKIYTHEGTTINHRYNGYTNGSTYNQTRYISEIQSWGGAAFGDCSYMFAMRGTGASTLKRVPKLSAGFAGVTSMAYMFYYCNSLTELADGLFDSCTAVTTFQACFYFCSGLTSLPADLFANCTAVTTFSYCFYSCTGLTSLPAGLFDNCPSVTTFSYCFYGCSGLTAIPTGLFDNCTAVTNFSYCFHSGSSSTHNLEGESAYDRVEINGVETVIHLYERENYPSIYTAPTSTSYCYRYQTKLDDYDSIPDGWK